MLSLKDALLDRVSAFIMRHDCAPAGARLGVAVSGGADSVVLLHLLHRIAATQGFSVVVIHVNHQLRGRESDEDEQSVRTLASSLDSEIRVFQAPVLQCDDNLEQAARDARRSVYRSLIADGHVLRVALGHTSSDQAETVLFRLLRGSGSAGLAGMRPVTADGLIRPLLTFSRTDVRQWAHCQGVTWREDSSNDDLRFRRNFVRNKLLPLVRVELNPGIDAVLTRMADVAQAEEDFWMALIQSHFEACSRAGPDGQLCDLKYLNAQPLAVRRRIVRRAVEEVKGDLRGIDSAHVDAVLKICGSYEGHDRVIMPGVDALRSFETLRLAKPGAPQREKRHYRLPVSTDLEIRLPYHAGTIRIDRRGTLSPSGSNCVRFVGEKDRIEVVMLDGDALGGREGLTRLVVRNWEPGDAYQPAGQRSSKKIKQLFQEGRVLLWERRHWPVLDLNGEIIWVRGFGPSSKFRAEEGNRSSVSLTYTPAYESNVQVSTS
jgi:tRNA(Ile)-lysidine synthase